MRQTLSQFCCHLYHRVMLALLAVACLTACSSSTPKPATTKPITLTLTNVTVRAHGHNMYLINCDATLDNSTGKNLQVTSRFYSAFDDFTLQVFDTTGGLLHEQPYTHHQSPVSRSGRRFTLIPGLNPHQLGFPVPLKVFATDIGATTGLPVANIRLLGRLPGSTYHHQISSAIVPLKPIR